MTPAGSALHSGGLTLTVQSTVTLWAPTPDPLTGRYYEESVTAKTWDEARVEAASRSFGGVTGHLATIGSELAKLYGALEARDLAAGSTAARRLFS